MATPSLLNAVCALSENIVAREIEGEIVIVPLTSGIGDAEDELYTLNETGREIWQRLDGKRTLKDVSRELTTEFESSTGEIEQDLIGFVEELIRRRILVKV